MAKFKVWLDTRGKKDAEKNYTFNLTIRASIKSDIIYLNIGKMTKQQFERIFIKKATDKNSIEYREKCNEYLTKCEKIFSELNPFSRNRFRELFYEKDKQLPNTLNVKGLFEYYIKNYDDIKQKTRDHYRTTMNVLETYHKDLTVGHITTDFMKRFAKKKKEEGCSQSTIDSHSRNIRRIVNYFTYEVKLIPKTYEYPFGKGGFSIKSFFPKKLVLKNDEIKAIVDLKDFDTPNQEYARDVWLLLYRCNGINFVDLLRMRWENIKGEYLIFFRKKTETTRKNNIKEITVPITPKVRELLDKLGVKDSPYILGKVHEGYSERTFENRNDVIKQEINRGLKGITKKLNLSVPLQLKTARDTYATTLKRNGVSKDIIGEMLGHSNSVVTEHYLASLDIEKTFDINKDIF